VSAIYLWVLNDAVMLSEPNVNGKWVTVQFVTWGGGGHVKKPFQVCDSLIILATTIHFIVLAAECVVKERKKNTTLIET
jgi:hypothetical protein